VVEAGGARLVLPFHERRRGAVRDVATLPGLSGALVLPEGADAAAAFALWACHARDRGWVTGYLQLSLGTADPDMAAAGRPGDHVGAHNALFVFDLARWDFGRDVKKKVRWTLRAGDRAGAVLVTGRDRLAEPFLRLSPQAMARLGAEAFPPAVLAHWLADPAVELFGAELGGQVVAVELVRLRGQKAELHLAGAAPEGRGLHGWLIWRMAEWFRDRGLRRFNIGGYGQAGDGLHEMKRRLGAREHPLRSLRQVYRPDLYARLCAGAGVARGGGYFPAYRAVPAAVQT